VADSRAEEIQDLKVMLVDDDESVLNSLSGTLKSVGIGNTMRVSDSRDVLSLLGDHPIGVILLDLTMPHISGQKLLQSISLDYPDASVIILTGNAELGSAVECMRNGAFDYLVKPAEESKLIGTVRKAIEIQELKRENRALRNSFLSSVLENPEAFSSLVTRSTRLHSIFLYIEAIARTSQAVLITGETGTGKELVAESIHKSSRKAGPFVAVNVAGFDDAMFSDSLFGHAKGAFTGSTSVRKGFVDSAAHGTLFLDEIGELNGRSQIKLLRLMEAGEYMPIGSDIARRSTARIVVATNLDLKAAVEDGSFRRDLYYRLRVHHVELPPLRERLEDIPALTEHFVQDAASSLEVKPPEIPLELCQLLRSHPFPGNIRELRSMIYDAVASNASGTLSLKTFRDRTANNDPPTPAQPATRDPGALETVPTIKQAVALLIEDVMARTDGNQAKAAEILGISAQALGKRLKRMNENSNETDQR
jgi:two-component system, NtrC family, nitrogen regulation response regulator GlnG